MNMPITYLTYLLVSAGITIGVARVLHSRGRLFLVRTFESTDLADSVNDLLVVGFYLINFGYVTLVLKYGAKPHTLTESIEFLSTKIGLVLLILGAMHCLNLVIFTSIAKHKPHSLEHSEQLST